MTQGGYERKDVSQLRHSRSDQRFRRQALLLQLIRDAILVHRFRTGKVVFCNRAASELYGWSLEEMLGRVFHVLLQTRFPEPLENIEATLLRKGCWEGELVHTRKDGNQVVVENRWVLRRDVWGSPVDVLQVSNDPTARKQAENMAAVAHEIANSLNGISISLELANRRIEKQHANDPFLVSTIQLARQEVQRMASLLDQLRSVAHPKPIVFNKIDLEENIKEALNCQLPDYEATGITVQLQLDKPLPPVVADSEKLKQVISNLCKNAIEAMTEGGVLTIRAYPLEERIILEISDTGVGIPEGWDIFKSFTTTKPSGTGLGLAIVREIITAHGGQIGYASEVGKGTTFKVSLPVGK